jgi:hypothetical protein
VVVVKAAKFHTCSPTTASMRSQGPVAVGEPMQRVAPGDQLLDPIG